MYEIMVTKRFVNDETAITGPPALSQRCLVTQRQPSFKNPLTGGKPHNANFPADSEFGAGKSGADSTWDYKSYVEVAGVDYRKRGMIYRLTQKGRKMLIKNELI